MAWIVVTYGHVEAVGEVVAGHGDEPVVAVDEVEVVPLAELVAGGEHVGVHLLDPGDEPVRSVGQLGSRTRWTLTPPTISSGGDSSLAARQHVDLDALADERLGELAHVPRQPALDHRRVLPGEDQDLWQVRLDSRRTRGP